MIGCDCADDTARLEHRTLLTLLAINGVMFLAEAVVGWIAESTALLADSLDMLADATVYGLAMYVVRRSSKAQQAAASISGVLQIALGIGVLAEIVRRAIFGSEPTSLLMVGTGCIALVANLICLRLISKHRDGGAHMRASWIFSKNDVIANTGVIIAGVLVVALGSRVPDLVVGSIVAVMVVRGGLQIWRDTRIE
ncbi:MAG TPA: cation transporter [Phycisphaerales bacterium]|nr:cation transporter [Phycisphaerales bacterium]|tara:strand:+ start:1470 stop:2057 length:588 start_codon:yes stop_codon:yes gene_type:complete